MKNTSNKKQMVKREVEQRFDEEDIKISNYPLLRKYRMFQKSGNPKEKYPAKKTQERWKFVK